MTDLIAEVIESRGLPRPNEARRIREAAGVTQDRLAREVDVHRVTLARWEAGTRVPRGAERVRYARILAELQRVIAA
ncbi:helix-turn-helix transcriptional regulator [Nocardioides sp.]|uniref:helix-turn-helix transcriptional regulator n=1 Tax=Nocardioides sp. TaxID=35761 RepID=UPI002BAA90CD|nr:helix-turn-helix transcriptional regulator [Nocardioides sp.]HSX67227.1 helix-turn-helix transcriptional regulator [Nocardioides sp.]